MNVIINYLESKDMTQEKFAESLGVGQSLVSQWATGRRPISLQRALQIEQIHGIDACLLNGQVNSLFKQLKARSA